MPPMQPPFFNPLGPWLELTYTLIIVLFCFLIYFKTKDIYDLTRHKGIKYFRISFLLFGLAYASRLLTHLLMVGTIALDFVMPRRFGMGLSFILMSYLSTMAILYLTYSTIWRRLKSGYFLIIANILATIIFVIAYFTQSNLFITILQFLLLVASIIISALAHKKDKKFSQIRVLYVLISLFWLVSLFIFGPVRRSPFELELALKLISIALFAFIYYRVSKWIK